MMSTTSTPSLASVDPIPLRNTASTPTPQSDPSSEWNTLLLKHIQSRSSSTTPPQTGRMHLLEQELHKKQTDLELAAELGQDLLRQVEVLQQRVRVLEDNREVYEAMGQTPVKRDRASFPTPKAPRVLAKRLFTADGHSAGTAEGGSAETAEDGDPDGETSENVLLEKYNHLQKAHQALKRRMLNDSQCELELQLQTLSEENQRLHARLHQLKSVERQHRKDIDLLKEQLDAVHGELERLRRSSKLKPRLSRIETVSQDAATSPISIGSSETRESPFTEDHPVSPDMPQDMPETEAMDALKMEIQDLRVQNQELTDCLQETQHQLENLQTEQLTSPVFESSLTWNESMLEELLHQRTDIKRPSVAVQTQVEVSAAQVQTSVDGLRLDVCKEMAGLVIDRQVQDVSRHLAMCESPVQTEWFPLPSFEADPVPSSNPSISATVLKGTWMYKLKPNSKGSSLKHVQLNPWTKQLAWASKDLTKSFNQRQRIRRDIVADYKTIREKTTLQLTLSNGQERTFVARSIPDYNRWVDALTIAFASTPLQ